MSDIHLMPYVTQLHTIEKLRQCQAQTKRQYSQTDRQTHTQINRWITDRKTDYYRQNVYISVCLSAIQLSSYAHVCLSLYQSVCPAKQTDRH